MDTSQRQWQSTLWLDKKETEHITFYGDTLVSLRQAVRSWLEEHKPVFFSSAEVECLYSDGTRTSQRSLTGEIEDGWYLRTNRGWPLGTTSPRNFETVLNGFIASGIYPEKGPDHQDRAIVDGKLQLHLIKTLKREREEGKANGFLKRGWYIVQIDHIQEIDSKSVYSVYVLGHPEEDAI